ncbi:hypothetical protein AGOR_G00033180 [Albula goreensis]|uniref:Cadherin domain-containing protein n=1 Tax=Albula goreensis TaxID=1534307 RepID=A0A8T3E356_9TELE|nr:hypothetical protein AGOR_G00033180 [Albula goreensis]
MEASLTTPCIDMSYALPCCFHYNITNFYPCHHCASAIMALSMMRFCSGALHKMTNNFPGVAFLFLMVVSQSAESCLPPSVQASVPRDVKVGYVIARVNLDPCGHVGLVLTSSDPSFVFRRDGDIVTQRDTSIPPQGRTFSVWVLDQNGRRQKMDVDLSRRSRQVGSEERKSGPHQRFKRKWSPVPFTVFENDKPHDMELIGSDSAQNNLVYYKIEGPGVTEDPKGLFSITEKGMLKINGPVDREQFPQFKFIAKVYDKETKVETDLPLEITVIVLDLNDNKPQFSGSLQFSLPEQSPTGTVVGKVNATDADDPETDNTKIKYTLKSEGNLFTIDPVTGLIKTKSGTPDREVQDKFLLTVEIKDLNGAANGHSTTATATVSVTDVNNYPPTFREKSYTVKVKENEGEQLLLRIPVDDKDLKNTPNWKALFKITKGNERGQFKIETDPKTNEGLLYITQPVDYETAKSLKLEVLAENEAPLVGTTKTWHSIPVVLTVGDVDEGPEFPPVSLWVKEDTPKGTVIGACKATDPETKSSAGMRYFKVTESGPDSWIDVAEHTGQLKTTNTVDRESEFVKNGLYNITVRAVDASSKSSTGTVIIHVIDVNDNKPTIVGPGELLVCEREGQLGSVLVTAEDRDQEPYSGPFTFRLAKEHDGSWSLKKANGTSVLLQQTKELPMGVYAVPLEVKDQLGSGETRTVTVRICRCQNEKCPAPTRSITLGVWGILALLLGLLLLLLVLCTCGILARREKDWRVVDSGGSGGKLIPSNTEGPGEEGHLTKVPIPALDQTATGSIVNIIKEATVEGGFDCATADFVVGHKQAIMDLSSMQMWRTNAVYLDRKLQYLLTEEDERYADDILKSYRFEGEENTAGSVGCCSDKDEHEDQEFLNTLGPKFTKLATICTKK